MYAQILYVCNRFCTKVNAEGKAKKSERLLQNQSVVGHPRVNHFPLVDKYLDIYTMLQQQSLQVVCIKAFFMYDYGFVLRT
jgi:hypothetical protein